jgi:hypothetical protein
MTKLLLNLATRNRPTIVVNTMRATLANLEHPDTVLMVSVDVDDHMTINMLGASKIADDPRVKISIEEREDTIGEKWNRAMRIPADLYMPMVDHTIPVTKGFDRLIVEAAERFPDGICAVHSRMANLSFAAYNAMTAKWVEITGEIYPTFFPYWFVDHWTDDLARMIGRIAYADVHCDWSQKPPTQEMREPGWWATWYDVAYALRRAQADKLIDAMDAPEGHKENLRVGYWWVEHRSRWINDNVRAQDKQLSLRAGLSSADDRYQRVKSRAVAMVPELLTTLPPTEALRYRDMLTPPTTVPALKQAFA